MRTAALYGARLLLSLALYAAPAGLGRAQDEAPAPARLANGLLVEGSVGEAVPDGLVIQTPRGPQTIPWKYLSAGTRYRYERPMRIEQDIARSNALKKAAAEAAAKAAAAKAAAEKAAAKAAATNAPAPAATNAPAPAATNAPARPAKKKPASSGS